jgi:protein-tyrosine-phosphatase
MLFPLTLLLTNLSNGTMSDTLHAVLFVCLHGSAKSLIAATHLSQVAESRGLPWRGESSGVEPDAGVPEPVITGLATDGIDVRDYRPRALTGDQMRGVSHVVSFGCDLGSSPPNTVTVERWDDVPLVSDGYSVARDAIVARVTRLLDRLQEPQDRELEVS